MPAEVELDAEVGLVGQPELADELILEEPIRNVRDMLGR